MSDPLNPYPGNLRRHIVDNSDLQVLILRTNDMEGLEHVRDIYEAARIDGANAWQTALRIKIPLIRDSVILTGSCFTGLSTRYVALLSRLPDTIGLNVSME